MQIGPLNTLVKSSLKLGKWTVDYECATFCVFLIISYLVISVPDPFKKTVSMWIICIPRLRTCTVVIHTISLEIQKPPVNEPIGSYQIQHLKHKEMFMHLCNIEPAYLLLISSQGGRQEAYFVSRECRYQH